MFAQRRGGKRSTGKPTDPSGGKKEKNDLHYRKRKMRRGGEDIGWGKSKRVQKRGERFLL